MTPRGDSLAAGDLRLLLETVAGRDVSPQGSRPRELVAVGSTLYFTSDGTLWASDGTREGTVPVTLPRDEGFTLGASFATTRRLFFTGRDAVQGDALWTLDAPTGEARRVKALTPGLGGSAFTAFTSVDDTLFFLLATLDTPNRVPHLELWKSDGTEVGTVRVRDMGVHPQEAGRLHRAGPRILLSFESAQEQTLWTSDGTEAGTVQLTQGLPVNGVVVGETLYFRVALDFQFDGGVWRSDGTPEGTYRIEALTQPRGARLIGGLKQTLYFATIDPLTAVPSLHRLVEDSRGETSTRLVATLPNPYATRPSVTPVIEEGVVAGDALLFKVSYWEEGPRSSPLASSLWMTNGTSGGTTLLTERLSVQRFEADCPLFAVNGQVLFRTQYNDGTSSLWATDGTTRGTRRLPDEGPRGRPAQTCAYTRAGDSLYFTGAVNTLGHEVWVMPLKP